MNTIKRLLALIVALATIFTFAACVSDSTEGANQPSSSVSSVTDEHAGHNHSHDDISSNHGGSSPAAPVKPDRVPAYSGKAYVAINNNTPLFSKSELTTTAYEKYSPLDSLGRCGVALASCGKEIMPADGEKRGSISSITPSGWVQAKYSGISGGYLWNRCHLISKTSSPAQGI